MAELPTIVFLHGFTNSGASWAPVIDGLGQRYRCLAPDIRGHGSASSREPVTLDAVIDDVSRLAPDRFTLCGYSQGGRLALHIALALAGRITRLVLIGASPGLADPAERDARRAADERLAAALEQMTIEQFVERWAQTPVLAGVSTEIAARARTDRLRSEPAGLARALRGLGTGALPSLWKRLGELKLPVTLLAGERDAKFSGIAREMAPLIPNAQVEIVPGSGHAVHLERPDAVIAVLAG
jgi:2-succinyl-6-hydroxy-2,4-cyclohexadiene-1-carboxylate synthase